MAETGGVSPIQGVMADAAPDTRMLVARAQAGDDEAYDRLFALVSERVRLFVRLRLGRGLRSKEDSDDVLQEVYLEAHRAFGRFRWQGDASFTRWLCRIAENAIRGLADHHGARKRTPPPGMARVSRIEHRLAGSGAGPATLAVRRERAEVLAAALDTLDDDLREVLLLRYFQGRTIDGIAHLMGRSPTSTRRLLGRAALALGTLLEEAS